MRRKDREMDTEFAWKVFDEAPFAAFALSDENGTPYCIPVSPARSGNIVYLHCAKDGHKLDIITRNNQVCLSSVSRANIISEKFTVSFASAVLRGKAVLVEEESEKILALRIICERYTPDNMVNFERAIEKSLPATCVVRIDVSDITGKQNV